MKLFLLLASVIVTASYVRAQGIMNFANGTANAVTNACTRQRVIAGTTFMVSAYYLPATGMPGEPVPTTADFDTFGVSFASIGFAGAGIYAAGGRTAPTVTPGGFGWFQVRSWETAFGASYEQARDNPTPQNGRLAMLGTSGIILVDTRDPTAIPPGHEPFYFFPAFYVGENICPIPEPAVAWLLVLGLGSLGWCCRRQKSPPTM